VRILLFTELKRALRPSDIHNKRVQKMMQSPRVMFVGEDHELWPELLRSPDRENWRFTFAHGADEALVALDEQDYDAVVANLKLPGISGAELLQEIRSRRPDIWRFLRAQPDEVANCSGWAGAAHQVIDLPVGVEDIQTRLNLAFTNQVWKPSPVAETLLSTCPLLPSPPKLYYKMVDLLSSPTASLERIGELIEQDAPMAAKMLQLVNSAIFALQLKVNRASDAVLYLGVETTKAVVLMAHTVSSFQSIKRIALPAEKILAHSFHVAKYARWIAQQECPRGQTSDQAFTAGLLHDIGKFLLAANRGEAYARAIEYATKGPMTLQQAEVDFFGVDHAELGGCLLASWGIPQPIVDAVAMHHKPTWLNDSGFAPVTAVHAANVLANEQHPIELGFAQSELDLDYIEAGGFSEAIERWRCGCVSRE
jgi:putative nucleotidyltransferase with HDIG domain